MRLQTDAPLTGRESLGVYHAFSEGTRVYLTLPTGERAGFTFRPGIVTSSGVAAGPGLLPPGLGSRCGCRLSTRVHVDALLVRGGDLFYDQATGQPYQAANPFFNGADYTLIAADDDASSDR